jgi:ribosomal protein L37E
VAQSCSECGSPMEPGFLADFGEGDTARAGSWIEGAPEMMRFLGLKVGIRVKGKRRVGVTALRCRRCGLLKLYARDET